MGKIITPVLPHDLPENWTDNQYVTPGGREAGLTEQHGYNYLMKQVNNAQKAIEELDAGVLASQSFNVMSAVPTSLSQTGWYRLATFEGAVNAPISALLFMGHSFRNGGSSNLLASINFYAYSPSIIILDHKFNSYVFFDRLRIVKNESRNQVYLDFRYGRDFENVVSAGLLTFNYREISGPVVTQTTNNFVFMPDLNPGDYVVLEQAVSSVANGSAVTTGSAVVPASLEE